MKTRLPRRVFSAIRPSPVSKGTSSRTPRKPTSCFGANLPNNWIFDGPRNLHSPPPFAPCRTDLSTTRVCVVRCCCSCKQLCQSAQFSRGNNAHKSIQLEASSENTEKLERNDHRERDTSNPQDEAFHEMLHLIEEASNVAAAAVVALQVGAPRRCG